MKNTTDKQTYVALLRGINVGGKHKVPMVELRTVFEDMGHSGVKTLLNSGNVVFDGQDNPINILESAISAQLEESFGFPIPVLVRNSDQIHQLIASEPFKNIEITDDIRLYVTFLKQIKEHKLDLPWISPDGSYRVLKIIDQAIISVLDVSKMNSPDAMNVLEKTFGKEITTRNWNTVIKIAGMLQKQ